MQERNKVKLPITEDAMTGIVMVLVVYIGAILYLFTPIGTIISNVEGSSGSLLFMAYIVLFLVLYIMIGVRVDRVFEYQATKRYKPVFRKKLRVSKGFLNLALIIITLPLSIPIIHLVATTNEHQSCNPFLLLFYWMIPVIVGVMIHIHGKIERYFDARYKLVGFFPKKYGEDRGVEVTQEGVNWPSQGIRFLWRDVIRIVAEADDKHQSGENDTIIMHIYTNQGKVLSTESSHADYEDVYEAVAAYLQLHDLEDTIGYLFYEDKPCAALVWKKVR